MAAKKNEVKFANKQTNRSLTRATKKRELAEPILIMCEGKKTEIHYFKGLCQRLGIGRPQIMIKQASSGNDPLHIVDDALELHKTDAYSKIYCVFDRDMHTRYDRAIEKIKTKGKSIPIVAIYSVPCFEYWLLLHFEYTSQQHT